MLEINYCTSKNVFVLKQLLSKIIQLGISSLDGVKKLHAVYMNSNSSFLCQQFQLPIESASSLKWHIVFDMLNAKMRTLGGRDLCDDEKDHLGSRLMLGMSLC